jgi:DNA invertase Pin-like site-specific DNA recombinase
LRRDGQKSDSLTEPAAPEQETQRSVLLAPALSVPTDWQTVCKRAAGRNKSNTVRTFRADCWRGEIITLLHRWGWSYGVQAQIARHLGMHRSTVSRDLNRI